MFEIWPVIDHVQIPQKVSVADSSVDHLFKTLSIMSLLTMVPYLVWFSHPTRDAETNMELLSMSHKKTGSPDINKTYYEASYCRSPELYQCNNDGCSVNASGCSKVADIVYPNVQIGDAVGFFLPTVTSFETHDEFLSNGQPCNDTSFWSNKSKTRYLHCGVHADGNGKCKCIHDEGTAGQWFVPGAAESGQIKFKVKPSLPGLAVGDQNNPPLCRLDGQEIAQVSPFNSTVAMLGQMDCTFSLVSQGQEVLIKDNIRLANKWGDLAIDIPGLFDMLSRIGGEGVDA
eukprot:TRINITY_DN98648_c0_g1_i1.p1 TRINITY_DN98648_c0_g1~~TRINITY_DN98648_c0_g1_i1.p1  ORF type:complete len:296 (-),score=38.70 TRINITY_DN98648_c0_g1_i1:62-922(-)